MPWHSAYASALLLSGPTRFVLGASGHIAGVINPASKGKRSHWRLDAAARGRGAMVGTSLPASADAWLESASEHPGSWWPDWAAWLAGQAGPLQAAPRAYGSPGYKRIEPAPGRYVKVRA